MIDIDTILLGAILAVLVGRWLFEARQWWYNRTRRKFKGVQRRFKNWRRRGR